MGLIRFFDMIITNDDGSKSKVEFVEMRGELWVKPMNVSWEDLQEVYKTAEKKWEAKEIFEEDKKKKDKPVEEKKNWFKRLLSYYKY